MRVLITGGAGFIGSHLAGFHLGRGDEVHVVDDLSPGSRENVDPGFQGIRHRKPSLDKRERLFGFEHEFTLEETIAELIAVARPAVQGAGATP